MKILVGSLVATKNKHHGFTQNKNFATSVSIFMAVSYSLSLQEVGCTQMAKTEHFYIQTCLKISSEMGGKKKKFMDIFSPHFATIGLS